MGARGLGFSQDSGIQRSVEKFSLCEEGEGDPR